LERIGSHAWKFSTMLFTYANSRHFIILGSTADDTGNGVAADDFVGNQCYNHFFSIMYGFKLRQNGSFFSFFLQNTLKFIALVPGWWLGASTTGLMVLRIRQL
jgi:hypothetical protein